MNRYEVNDFLDGTSPRDVDKSIRRYNTIYIVLTILTMILFINFGLKENHRSYGNENHDHLRNLDVLNDGFDDIFQLEKMNINTNDSKTKLLQRLIDRKLVGKWTTDTDIKQFVKKEGRIEVIFHKQYSIEHTGSQSENLLMFIYIYDDKYIDEWYEFHILFDFNSALATAYNSNFSDLKLKFTDDTIEAKSINTVYIYGEDYHKNDDIYSKQLFLI